MAGEVGSQWVQVAGRSIPEVQGLPDCGGYFEAKLVAVTPADPPECIGYGLRAAAKNPGETAGTPYPYPYPMK